MAATERVTITLAAKLVEGIDRLERNRSRFIATAVEHELERRRRELLDSSLRQPHSETLTLADDRLADWAVELPEDEGLIDVTKGTAVRWIDGRGWVKQSS